MYITYTDVQSYLGITFTAPQQAQVTTLIAQLQALVNRYCNRSWDNTGTLTELFNGGIDVFFVAKPKIATIVSVKEDGVALAATDYFNYGTHIKTEYILGDGHNNIEIQYTQTSGVPDDIKMVLIQWTAEEWSESSTPGGTPQSVTVGPVTVDYGAKGAEATQLSGLGIPDEYENVLNGYRLDPLGL